MATNILMPALSPTMTEGTLARWLKKEGEQVRAGDIIAEIETDKATMEVEAVDEGVLGRILVPDGTAGVKVNEPIAVLVADGESAAPTPGPGVKAEPPAAKAPQPDPERSMPANPKTTPAEAPAAAPHEPLANGHDAPRLAASPLARRMAKQAGLDLTAIKGTGPNGRIVRADVEAAQQGGAKPAPTPAASPAQPAAATPAPAAPAIPPPAKPSPVTAPHQAIPNSTMRKVISRRLTESHQQVPNFFVTLDMEIDALLKLRADLNAKSPKDGPAAFKLSVNDLVIKAAAATLRRVPKMNATYTEDSMILYDDVDISVAVSMPDGLITPIIRNADQKGLAAISNAMKDLAGRAKTGKLKPDEFQGGTFSISNLGMFGTSQQFTAIINPPQAAILAVGAGEKRPVVQEDHATTVSLVAIATVMTCARPSASTTASPTALSAPNGWPCSSRSSRIRSASCCSGIRRTSHGHRMVGARLRSHRRRRRTRRLRRRHPRRPARHEGRRGGTRTPRRHLPQLGLHPDQGAAPLAPRSTICCTISASSASPPTISGSISDKVVKRSRGVAKQLSVRRHPSAEEEQDRGVRWAPASWPARARSSVTKPRANPPRH